MFSVRLVSLREQIDVEFAVSKKFGFRLAYWKTYNHKQMTAHANIPPGSHLREPGEDFIHRVAVVTGCIVFFTT
jgi:hypothetical protein